MSFNIIDDQNKWDLSQNELLQSSAWALFQKSLNHEVSLYQSAEGRLLTIKNQIKFLGSYFYSPRGPKDVGLVDDIKKAAKDNQVIFWRLEPLSEDFISLAKEQGLIVKKTIPLQPEETLVLDLSKSEAELLADMKQKTRYNIKLAEKKKLEIREGREEDFEYFWQLMKGTGARDGFRTHTKDYYYHLFKNTEKKVKLYLASYQNKVIAAAFFSFFAETVTYIHGASSHEDRQLMAPYLLQWELIKKAKSLGYKYYDFYGISENKWPGVTRFKLGFGGFQKKYPGTFDLVFKPGRYALYKLIRKIRRLI
jgi:lipid II:glycine glycyltransferase (peptidoglycan interpeptide bridge formation enzyme)